MLDHLQGERNIGIYKLSPYPTLSWNIYGRTRAPFSFPGRFAVVDIFTKPFYFAEQMLQLSVDFIFRRCSFSNLRTKSFAFFHGLLQDYYITIWKRDFLTSINGRHGFVLSNIKTTLANFSKIPPKMCDNSSTRDAKLNRGHVTHSFWQRGLTNADSVARETTLLRNCN